ncbi:mucin-binding protein [Enterococcus cecorum]|uniref:LPXTG cell wall anchor domain-containing protein n=1 Tax=Enterococcus cecorum TaxID=44008 RepID=A0A7X9RID6_9ENTE|nr:LPXTG cell wall anchor domain-containing protein [Enterococcus cecorum]NME48960.1 LPXTG cell wall anchor domain-containing protein [Enterococcus cecorum]
MTNESLSGTWNVTESNSDIVIHVKKRFDNDSESKTITRTIHITNPDGTKKDIVQIVTCTRSKSTDLSNNQISFGEWETSKDTFDEMTIPSIHGYTANIDFVESMKVNPDSENTEISVNYTENVIKLMEEKDFIRQIIVKKPDGTKEMITQKVHGTRIKTVHEASGETSYSDWVLDQNKFDSYNPKQMEGYHVENVAEQEVDINQSEPIVILVEYKVDTSDSGTQTDTPDFSDGSTQTDNPTTSDNGTQTDNSDTGTQTNSLPLAEKKPAKTQNNKPNLLQEHKMRYTSSNRGTNKLPQAGSKEPSTLGVLGVSMLVIGGIVRIFKRKKYTN